jgi:PTH1 family peptidyl-tRNA hydrolase
VAADLWLVVGLGNPGPRYADNRHNVGFRTVELLAGRAGERFGAHRGRADVAQARLDGQRVVLAKPKSYMNESGGPVASLRDYFKVAPDRLVVVHDELYIPFGAIRLKLGGGDNGHNGLRSLRRSLGTGEFYRVRFGIGRPPGQLDPADYVLRDFSATERRDLPLHLEQCADAVESLLLHGLAASQTEFHQS